MTPSPVDADTQIVDGWTPSDTAVILDVWLSDAPDAEVDSVSAPEDIASGDAPETVAPGIPCSTDADCPTLSKECQETYCTEDHVCAVRDVPDGQPCRAANLCGSERYCQGGWCYLKAHHCEESCMDEDCLRRKRCSLPEPQAGLCRPENPCMLGTLDGDGCVETHDLLGADVYCHRAGHVGAIVPLAEGQALLLGQSVTDHNPEDFVPTTAAWIARMLPGGSVAWERLFDGVGRNELHAAVELPSGDLLAVGVKVVDGWTNAFAIRLTSEGATVWEQTYGGHSITDFTRILLLTDGSVAVAGKTDGQPVVPTRLLYARLDPTDGEILTWETFLPAPEDTDEEPDALTSAALLPFEDGVVIAGELIQPTWQGWYAHLSQEGILRWSHFTKPIAIRSLALMEGGPYFLAAGVMLHDRIVPGGTALGYHIGIGVAGADGLVSTMVYQQPYAAEIPYFITATEGGYLLGGVSYGSQGASPVLIRLNLLARTMWRDDSLFPSQAYVAFHAGAALSDGSVLLGGGAGSSGISSAHAPLLVRTDIWGNTSCSQSGACFQSEQYECFDFDNCTYIRCTSASGCYLEPQEAFGYGCHYTKSGTGCGQTCTP